LADFPQHFQFLISNNIETHNHLASKSWIHIHILSVSSNVIFPNVSLVLVRFRWEAALESGKSKQDETEIRAVWGATSVGLGETSGIFLSAIFNGFPFSVTCS